MKILNEANPSTEQIIEWGYDEEMYLIEQDEDLILHDAKYILVLIKLASDKDCPKQKYCEAILEYFTQQELLFRAENELKAIKDTIYTSNKLIKTEWLKNWQMKFDYLYNIFRNPVELSVADCEKIANDLNVGDYSRRKVILNKTFENGILEFKVYYGSFRQFFYINPKSGNWKISKYESLDRISI